MSAEPGLSFSKYTALGNDYLVAADAEFPSPLEGDLVRWLCDRRFGVGADGILLSLSSTVPGPYAVRIFNSDGSECERSGNGLRIFSQWLRDTGVVMQDRFAVRCAAGTSGIEINSDGTVAVEMGAASYDAQEIGLAARVEHCERFELPTSAGDLDVTSLSVGNPHTVVFTDLPVATRDLLGLEIATHPYFRGGTNVQFVRRVGPGLLDIEVWERGSGRTLASGSSACAAAAAALSRGLVGEGPVEVSMPGGQVTVHRRDGEVIWQRGRSSRVFTGRVDLPPLSGRQVEGE